MMNVLGWKWYLLAGSILIAFIDIEKQFLMNWEDFFWFRTADELGNLSRFVGIRRRRNPASYLSTDLYTILYDFFKKTQHVSQKYKRIKNFKKKWRKSFVFSSISRLHPPLKNPKSMFRNCLAPTTLLWWATNKMPKAKSFSNFLIPFTFYSIFSL